MNWIERHPFLTDLIIGFLVSVAAIWFAGGGR